MKNRTIRGLLLGVAGWAAVAVGALGSRGESVSGPQDADGDGDIRRFIEDYDRAWNSREAAALAMCFAEDADLILENLSQIRGRPAIEAWWRACFDRQDEERWATFDVTESRLLAPDVALVNLATIVAGAGTRTEQRVTWLLHRHTRRWQVAAMRALPAEGDRVELVGSLDLARQVRPGIRAFVAAYADALNLHDVDALSRFFHEDADIVIREQPVVRGRQAIRSMWSAYFEQPRPYRALLIIEEIRMVSDEVALVNVTGAGALLEGPSGLAPTRTTRATWVLVRGNEGEWLLGALRVLPSTADRVVRNAN